MTDESPPVAPVVAKYWNQRYRLFHRFDDGIMLNEEGWYSVTPEKIAAHIAERCSEQAVIVDLFSGPGGNCIQFALHGAYVIGVERNAETIAMARHNAEVYQVSEYIDFIQADVYEILPKLAEVVSGIDAIFMSPPWGGPTYQDGSYDVGVFSEAVFGALRVTDNVCVLIPRNVTMENVAQTFGSCEVEKNFLGRKIKTQTLYFGGLRGNTKKMRSMRFAPAKEKSVPESLLMPTENVAGIALTGTATGRAVDVGEQAIEVETGLDLTFDDEQLGH